MVRLVADVDEPVSDLGRAEIADALSALGGRPGMTVL
jgi:hypothetical protein